MRMNTTYQNLYNSTKAGLKRNFIALNPYMRIEERSQINNFSFYLRN